MKSAKEIFADRGYPSALKNDYASFNKEDIEAIQLNATQAARHKALTEAIEKCAAKKAKSMKLGHTEGSLYCGLIEDELEQLRDSNGGEV